MCFLPANFARARAEGYLLTMHCDVDQPNLIEHIRQALTEIQVDRVVGPAGRAAGLPGPVGGSDP